MLLPTCLLCNAPFVDAATVDYEDSICLVPDVPDNRPIKQIMELNRETKIFKAIKVFIPFISF